MATIYRVTVESDKDSFDMHFKTIKSANDYFAFAKHDNLITTLEKIEFKLTAETITRLLNNDGWITKRTTIKEVGQKIK